MCNRKYINQFVYVLIIVSCILNGCGNFEQKQVTIIKSEFVERYNEVINLPTDIWTQENNISPDGKMYLSVIPERSLIWRARTGYNSIILVNRETKEKKTILSLWEADPGSGFSFHFFWSIDSIFLHIRGGTQGFNRGKLEGFKKL